MMICDDKDYAKEGLSVRAALLDQFKRFPDKASRPRFLLWGGLRVTTADSIQVPVQGVVKIEILASKGDIEQGIEIDTDQGLLLRDGRWVRPLRIWNDYRCEPTASYEFRSHERLLWVSNVYKMRYPGGRVVEEKWTENAGFWIEIVRETERIYHCSHGMTSPPDFESLVFKISHTPPH